MRGFLLLALFLCVLQLVPCWSRRAWHSPRYYGINKRASTKGFTWDGRPCPITNGCLKLPRTSDLLTRQEYESLIVGRNLNIMYRMDAIPLGNLYRFEVEYFVEGDRVFVDLKARMDGMECIGDPRFVLGDYISESHAIIYNPSATFPSNVTLEPTYYFMSDCPSEYVIKFTCAYSSTIRNGFCNGHYTVYIELTANPPDSVPWYKIENELYKKLGLRMNEPINKLLYRGEGCP